MAFIDECVLFVRAGRGGDGSASMHSEPYKPLGGPDGGKGGQGGSVVFEVSRGVRDLAWLADHPHQRAEAGKPGGKAKRDGGAGKDLVLQVPDGTVVHADGELVADLVGEGARAIVARGGRGGRGNAALASSRNRVPRAAEPGEDGEELRLDLEVRTVADVGLVGLPNAGKSTLLSVLTAATPKVGDYPFTTLTPNLGVADIAGDRFVVADVPGLIEGAAEGKGLGHRFLRHVMRCRALLLVVDLSGPEPAGDLSTLRAEMGAYDPGLPARPSLVVGTKADLVEAGDERMAALGSDACVVSAVTGQGIDELRLRLASFATEAIRSAADRESHVILRPGRPRFTVKRDAGGRFHVRGRTVERWVMETDMDDADEVAKLQARLIKEGVERKLASMGACEGDEVEIRGHVFDYIPEPSEEDA